MALQPIPVNNDTIKEVQTKEALQRIVVIQKFIPESVKENLLQLKLPKYNGQVHFFVISQQQVINEFANEWDKFVELHKPLNDIHTLSEYVGYHKHNVMHSFWDLILKEILIYCKKISRELFENPPDDKLCHMLNTYLCIRAILDMLQSNLMLKATVINNTCLQRMINSYFGSNLDVEKWKRFNEKVEDDTIYQQYVMCLQKLAHKSGKEFLSLYESYETKIRNETETNRSESQMKQRIQPNNNYVIISTVIIVVLAVLFHVLIETL
eukprot:516352_1